MKDLELDGMIFENFHQMYVSLTWIDVASDKNWWWALVNVVMNLWVQ